MVQFKEKIIILHREIGFRKFF